MQILLATKETLQKRRNLFGLGLTSLIAACSGADGAGGGDPDTLPFKAEKFLESEGAEAEALTEDQANGYTATIETTADFTDNGATTGLDVKITKPDNTSTFLTLSGDAGLIRSENTASIYKLTDTYDLVLSAPNIESSKGGIFIYWDVAEVTSATDAHLEITSETGGDKIGINSLEFFQLGGKDEGGHDMVFASQLVGRSKGAIYILWDVAEYKSKGDHTISFININYAATGAVHGLLTISGTIAVRSIGRDEPDFLQLGGAIEGGYDMIIRTTNAGNVQSLAADNVGAIYILWDIKSYYKSGNTRGFDLRDTGSLSLSASVGATAGSLAIYGAIADDYIGTHAPEFLQLGGKEGNNHDMIIRSEYVDKSGTGGRINNEGAIYILWDINDYYQDDSGAILNKRIDLGEANAEAGNYATAGLLTIKGAIAEDQIGIHETEFLQLGKENDKYDLIIRSEHVDKTATSAGANTGAIYVLWDVADYAGGNETITLTSLSDDASSGLLTIYGTAGSSLGSSNILYRDDSDVDDDGTNDLVFKDKDYTYVLFGDQLGAVNADTGKVTSKTIDLDQIQVNTNGFFGYAVDAELGYRFDGSKTFEAVKATFSSSLSDTDSDLGVWDIA